MLPIPFIKFVPKIFKNDSKATNLSNKIDIDLKKWKKDIINIRRLNRVDECSASYLDELGTYLEADLRNYDSELIKRRKVRDAVETHPKRSRFEDDVKIKIDNITGYDPGARLISQSGSDGAWIVTGDGLEPSDYYWSSVGSDDTDEDLGLFIGGDGEQTDDHGIVRIDLHEGITTAVLDADTIEQIKLDLDDSSPAYYKIFLGYLNASGVFTEYPNGRIE